MQAAAPARRGLTPFARKHSVLAAAATSAPQPAAKPSVPSASLAAEVQGVIAATLGVRAAPSQPLMEAGMDSLGEAALGLDDCIDMHESGQDGPARHGSASCSTLRRWGCMPGRGCHAGWAMHEQRNELCYSTPAN